MIPQSTRVDRRRNEGVPQRVHRWYWSNFGGIPIVVYKGGLGHGRAGERFNGNDIDLGPVDFIVEKGEGQTGEIAAAPGTADDDIHLLFSKLLQLLLGFQPDNGLVQTDPG